MLSIAALGTAGAIVYCDRKTIKLEKEDEIISQYLLPEVTPPSLVFLLPPLMEAADYGPGQAAVYFVNSGPTAPVRCVN